MNSRLDAQAILSAPKFKQLRAERAVLRWTLSLATLVMYFGLILLVLTERSALGVNIPGTSTPIWFALILVATLLVVVFTGIYVRKSNSRFDRLAADLLREFGQ
jgi:uncharacterized membrane protein (DUF485 family)